MKSLIKINPEYRMFTISAVSFILILVADFTLLNPKELSILPVFLFWTAISQGAIALAAVVKLSNGRWLDPLVNRLNALFPLTLLSIVGFIFFTRHIGAYPWFTNQGVWFSTPFFILRHVVVLSLTSLTAMAFVDAVEYHSPRIRLYAGLYLLMFVICQSLLAYDILMAFDYPFVNTLFGGYFFVEALYAGLVVASIYAALLIKGNQEMYQPVLKDCTTFVLGMALFWAGLFYSQYLVIWYGNIGEEVHYLTKRISGGSLGLLGYFILFALFILPFFIYLRKEAKINPKIAVRLGVVILAGLMCERIILVVSTSPINLFALLVHFCLFGAPFYFEIRRQIKQPSY